MVSLWWEEVDSYKSESERVCTHSEASSTERWFRIHPNMRKRWIASALGKFVYKLRNATKGITRICKVNNGAVAVCNGANGCFATVLHPLSFAKKSSIAITILLFLVGRGGFEPPKAVPTDLQSAPFGHSGIFPRLELVVGVEPTTC